MKRRKTPDLHLRESAITETVSALQNRINDRFPDSGLSRLCGHLVHVAETAANRSSGIGRGVPWIRVCGYGLAVLLIGSIAGTIWTVAHSVRISEGPTSWTEIVGMLDGGANVLLILCAGLYFLISMEIRIKRRRALAAVHELRSISHVVDMHQLTKDPERMLSSYQSTSNSPTASMTPFELNRYLDYCSEMLSLIGKLAALYVQEFDDPLAVEAVSDLEQLTTSLSRKIWQKIVLLNQISESGEPLRVLERKANTDQQSTGEDGTVAPETQEA